MSSEQNKWSDAVAKLIKLTQDREVMWRTATQLESDIDSKDNLQGVVYVADQKNRTLRLYKLRFKEERSKEDIYSLGAILSRPSKQPDFILVEVAKLELIDYQGNTLFTFPQVSGLKDLYSSVSYQVAGVEEFLNELLSA